MYVCAVSTSSDFLSQVSARSSLVFSVCQQLNLQSYGRILMNFSGNIRNGIKEQVVRFWGDLDHHLDSGIFKVFFTMGR